MPDYRNSKRLQPTQHLLFVLLLTLLFLSACESTEDKVEDYLVDNQVLPLKNALTVTDQMAQSWEEDAFLTLASISFGWSETSDFQVFYESPSKPNSALWIYSENGITNQETIGSKLDPSKEISSKDWVVDSSEILEIVLNQKDVIGFAQKSSWEICGYINLQKSNGFSDYPLLWQVQVKNCINPIESISVYLDPISGYPIEGGN